MAASSNKANEDTPENPFEQEGAEDNTVEELNTLQEDADLEAALQQATTQEDEPLDPEQLKEDYEARLAEMKDQLMRAVAESENIRKRSQRDQEETSKYSISGFARDLISVAENLQRAYESIPDEERKDNPVLDNLATGVDMTLKELLNVFERHGIRRIHPLEEAFDHNMHQAVVQIDSEEHEPGTVLQVMQAGYVIHNRLLQPAMVGVSRKASGGGGEAHTLDTEA